MSSFFMTWIIFSCDSNNRVLTKLLLVLLVTKQNIYKF